MNRTRPKQIVIRVSEEELAQIKKKVEQSGKSQQQYIIEALTQKQVINTDGIKEIYPELKRQGNNLNQIAAFFNSGGIQSRAMHENINHAIACIFEMREQVAEMAGKNYGNLKAHRK